FVLQDLSAEFDPNNPVYGERDGAAWIPVSIRDWAGHEIARTYSDEYGCYDAMVVSTYNADVPCPSGYAPTITTVVLNDPTMPADPTKPNGPRIADPYWNPAIGTAPVPLEYFPGKVNYADTPVIPIGAFQGGPNGQLDVEQPSGTPVIKTVAGTLFGTNAGPVITNLSHAVTLTSLGQVQVLDPSYHIHSSATPNNKVLRDYGFGATLGTVKLYPTDRSLPAGTAVPVTSWNDTNIVFHLPATLPPGSSTYTHGTEWQLMVTRANGKTTPIGITLTYEPDASHVHVVNPPPPMAPTGLIQPAAPPNTAIQDVVDDTPAGDLVIVPFTPYAWNEYVIMYRPIRLQGSGVGTVINGVPDPQSRVPAWHKKITSLLGGDDPFVINECPGVEVFGETTQGVVIPPNANPGDYVHMTGFDTIPSRIDGFLFKGAIHGGGINVYNEGSNLRISNNRIKGNMGDTFNGGISIGAPAGGGTEGGTFGEDPGSQTTYNNTNVVMEYNEVLVNSSLDGGGGIAVNSGAVAYKIRNNWIMGNFCFDSPGAATATAGAGNGGAGILHIGLCPGGLIADNVIAFNEVYFGYSTGGGDGAGICIQGEADGGSPTGTSGTGSVMIYGNLIMGNLAGAGLGGGIRLAGVNGPEILDTNNPPVFEGNPPFANPTLFPDDFVGTPSADPTQWYEIDIFNNIIVNNAAGFAGGGISIQDAIKVKIINNTIANNDAAAVALNTFPPNRGRSVPQGAGIVTYPNSSALPTNLPAPYHFKFSNPTLENNIITHNRSYLFDYALVGRSLNNTTNHMPINDSGGLVPDPNGVTNSAAGVSYVDLYVVGGGSMTPQNCILSTNANQPAFVSSYINSNHTALVYDEGGNNSISLRFEPIGVYLNSTFSPVTQLSTGGAVQGNYHLAAPLGGGANVSAILPLQVDYDGQPRAIPVDIGADQLTNNAAGIFLPGVTNANLVVDIVGVLPNPNNNPYTPTPALVPGEPPHLPENEPIPEANPLIAPGPAKPPTVLNPVWMTAQPTGRSFVGQFNLADIQNWYNFTMRLQGFDPYNDLGNLAPVTASITNDPVGQYVFDHLSGNWPDAPLADGEEPPAPRFDTKNMLALWNYGWAKYTQPANIAPTDDVMFGLILADLNRIITTSGLNLYTLMAPGGVPKRGYSPSDRTKTLAAASPVNQPMLNRSVIQDAFLEVRRWYDPAVAYTYLVCGDGFAEMADGTELYIFGFSDQTAVANNPTDDPNLGPDKVMLNAHAAATISAPTLVVKQGQTFHLDLGNVGFAFRPDLFDPHTIHFHGFPNASPIFDGMPLASMAVHEGATIPYFYNLKVEGTYFYHCHVEATEHMQQGMIGNLYVQSSQNDLPVGTTLTNLPPGKGTTHQAGYKYAYTDGDGSTYYDVEYPIQVTGIDHYFHDQEIAIQPPAFATLFDTYPVLNGRGYPDTINTGDLVNSLGQPSQRVNSLMTAKKGQRILIRYSNVSETEFDTLTVPGIPMTVIAKDARLLRERVADSLSKDWDLKSGGKNLFYRTTSITLGGGETADFILDTTNTQPGTYFLYTARLNQLSNDQEDYGGMMTHIVITP
ncbi:MAG: multicopper oxidase domain-containing protein, partial [Verrucomicrobia bacterium]|nr:multicopper oxidase domain-containing protein [Verrucomicrobiota bacterium]